MVRQKPNVLIAGTPGTGKTCISKKLMKKLTDFQTINVSEFCKTNDCIESHDKELDTDVVDEDILEEKLSPIISSGGFIIDYHSADLFPKELIDVVFIIRCNNTVLYDRLKSRGYSQQKISNNIECEIFETIVEESNEWFGSEAVHQLTNESINQLDTNCQQIYEWIQKFNENINCLTINDKSIETLNKRKTNETNISSKKKRLSETTETVVKDVDKRDH